MSGHSKYSINSRRIWFWKSPNLKEPDSKEIPTYLIRNIYKNIVAITSKLFNIPSYEVTHCCWIKYSIRIPLWVMCVCVCVCVCVCMRACVSCSVVSVSLQPTRLQMSMKFSRQEYWSGLPFPSPQDPPDPRIKPSSPSLQADSLPSEASGKPQDTFIFIPIE